jgi:mycofactocin glycosyltransferase
VTPWPEGFVLTLDRSVRVLRRGTVLVGGHPGRAVTLSTEGARTLASLLDEGPGSEPARQLALRLVVAGMAHPRPSGAGKPPPLDRCLDSLGPEVPVVVVDDASDDPAAVASVCRHHGARLMVRTVNGGPAAARNDALATIDTELVAFVDSDCRVTAGWLERLVGLFDDPAVAAVAPRVRPERPGRTSDRSVLARYLAVRSPLDLGPDPSEVGSQQPVRYLPTAALVVRRAALATGFDPNLRVGEDVDLVWRLLEAGWRVRYEPSVIVHHREPTSWMVLFGRRFRYGTSAGPLAARHRGRLPSAELRVVPTVAALAGLAGRPRVASAVILVSTASLARRMRPLGIPWPLTLRWSVEGAAWTAVGLGRAATMVAGPVLAVVALRRRPGGRAALALLVAPGLVEWWQRRPELDPFRWSAAAVVDDLSYGAGVWVGCFRSRSFGPLMPAVRLRWPPAPE